jgi:hypothetical protein
VRQRFPENRAKQNSDTASHSQPGLDTVPGFLPTAIAVGSGVFSPK